MGFPWPLIVLPTLGFTAIGLILKLDEWLDRKDQERRMAMLEYLLARAAQREREANDNAVTETSEAEVA